MLYKLNKKHIESQTFSYTHVTLTFYAHQHLGIIWRIW